MQVLGEKALPENYLGGKYAEKKGKIFADEAWRSDAAFLGSAIEVGLGIARQYLDLPSGASGLDAALDVLANPVQDKPVGFCKGRKGARLIGDIANLNGSRGRKSPFSE